MPDTLADTTAPGACPVCGSSDSRKLYPDYTGRCITTQMQYCESIELDNRWCAGCGFIWNRGGLRHSQQVMFDTQVQKPRPQIVAFDATGKTAAATPLQKRALEVFASLAEIPPSGSMLDFGAGNGSFLRWFHQAYPGWKISGLEPRDDFMDQVRDLPMSQASNKPYYASDIQGPFDMVIIMSVLEHVPDPLHALRWIHERLAPGGLLLMRHPNFACLPGDLFCADHLGKLTAPHTRQLAEHVGFELLAEDLSTLMFFFAMRRTEASLRPLPDCGEETLAIAQGAEHVAVRTVEAVQAAVDAARQAGSKAAIFGTSAISAMAHLVLGCREHVACFVDENANTWGCTIDGLPVVGPASMAELGVSDLALAMSPLYWDQVGARMRELGVRVHVPQVERA